MSFCLEISGDYACFTRPEMKVERVSYDVITPSAVRAIFEAILWKPAISWKVHKIEVLKPVRWVNIRRNEVGSVLPIGNINKGIRGGSLPVQYVEEQRQQRAGLLLKDVAYRIHASFDMTKEATKQDNPGKFAAMFKRRVNKGQCFNQPYLGSLGWMLYDMNFQEKETTPLFFNPMMEKGVIQIPDKNSEEVRR